MATRKINNIEELENAIAESEILVKQKHAALKEQFFITKASLKPANIAKNTVGNLLEQFVGNGSIGNILVKALGGITAGAVAGKIISPSKQGLSLTAFAANAAKTWGAALLANNADKLMAYGTSIIHNLFAKKRKMKMTNNKIYVPKQKCLTTISKAIFKIRLVIPSFAFSISSILLFHKMIII